MKLQRPQPEFNLRPSTAETAKGHISQSEKTIDPYAEVDERARNMMLHFAEGYARAADWYAFTEICMAYKILFPEKTDDLPLDPHRFNSILEEMNMNKQSRVTVNYMNLAACLAMLYPERKSELSLTTDDWDRNKAYIDSTQGLAWQTGSETMFYASIIWPERQGEIKISDQDWVDILHTIQNMKDLTALTQAIEMAVQVCIMFPDKKQEILNIIPTEMIREEMEKHRPTPMSSDQSSYLKLVAALYVLTAEKTHIDNRGIQITKKSELNQMVNLPTRNKAA